jgi:hypothetical protein
LPITLKYDFLKTYMPETKRNPLGIQSSGHWPSLAPWRTTKYGAIFIVHPEV